MPSRPDYIYPALAAAYNAGDLAGVLALYDSQAVFVVKPGQVTDGPAQLHAALQRVIEFDGHLAIHPHSFVHSDNVVLVLGSFTLTGRRRDGTQIERESRFADVLRRRPGGDWLIAVDNPFNEY
jgi:ketosteroid isomerase-like protein